jgi:transcription antitermination factor NusG
MAKPYLNQVKQCIMNKCWYVLYTKSNCEKKVAELISKQGFESYCPLNKVYRQWSDRRKQISIPLFTSYVFVNVEEKELARVRSITSSIVSPVYWLGRPAVIQDAEIQEIRNFLNNHSEIKLEKRPVDLNDQVVIMRGPFYNQHGIVQSVKNHSVVLSLPSLGYNMIAELDISNIQVVYTFNNEVDYKKHASLSVC